MARCTVKFSTGTLGPSALLMHRGRSINAINFPRGTKLTAKAKARARRRLMKGCAELSRGAH